MPRVFVDLATSVLPLREMQAIQDAPSRVIRHEFGAWVHVPPQEADDDVLTAEHGDEGWSDFPHLLSILLFARGLGADWINFDGAAADTIEGYPTFHW